MGRPRKSEEAAGAAQLRAASVAVQAMYDGRRLTRREQVAYMSLLLASQPTERIKRTQSDVPGVTRLRSERVGTRWPIMPTMLRMAAVPGVVSEADPVGIAVAAVRLLAKSEAGTLERELQRVADLAPQFSGLLPRERARATRYSDLLDAEVRRVQRWEQQGRLSAAGATN